MNRRIIRVLILMLFALLLLASIEIAARIFFPRRSWESITRDPYPELMADYDALSRAKDPNNFTSPMINVRNGERVTVDQPSNAIHDIYILGDSTTWGWFNDDAHTLPSELQYLIRSYRVHNRGGVGSDALLMFDVVKHLNIKSGDIVIFYSGEIDTEQFATDLDAANPMFCRFLLQNANDIILFHWLCDPAIYAFPPSPYGEVWDKTLAHYAHAIVGAKQYVEQAKGKFYNVLQPVKMTRPLSAQEKLYATYEPVFATETSIYLPFYDALASVAPRSTIDLRHVLDAQRASGVEVYLDNYHITDNANAIVARALRDAIWQTF